MQEAGRSRVTRVYYAATGRRIGSLYNIVLSAKVKGRSQASETSFPLQTKDSLKIDCLSFQSIPLFCKLYNMHMKYTKMLIRNSRKVENNL